jgi:hypothetical protein
MAHVDMYGLITVKTIKEKTIRVWNIKNCWHPIRLGRFPEERADVATVYLLWSLRVHPVVEGTLCSVDFTGVAPCCIRRAAPRI